MEKNVLIAIVLSIVVLVVFNFIIPQPVPVVPKKPPVTASSATGAQGVAQVAETAAPITVSVPAPTAEKLITVDTDLYTAVLSTNGGVVKSWRLKKYNDASGAPSEMVVSRDGVMPLAVVPDGLAWADAQKLPYSTASEGLSLTGKDEEGEIILHYVDASGSAVTKALKFRNGSYAVEASVSAQGYKGYTLYMGDGFGSLTPKDAKTTGYIGTLSMIDGEKHKDAPKDLKEDKLYQGKEGWASVTDKYFMAAVIPADGINVVVGRGESEVGSVGLKVLSAGGVPKADFLFYAGPKEYDRLKALGHGLDRAVDFGWFTFIAKPLFVALKFFYDMVHNYGLAIIIITVIIKALFAPLTHKSQKSMKRMQKLQPHFAELKEKYKGDPQRMNKEMMELYKKHKVNPMGGCLPMVVQIPVFIALYNVLNNSIELRQAPFMWWLHDLSSKDPYYVLPVLMGLSMLVMQKMTPTSMDPKQNKIMMMMPVVMTFMFISLPSGLVLYFTISNALSMAQQIYINKYSVVD